MIAARTAFVNKRKSQLTELAPPPLKASTFRKWLNQTFLPAQEKASREALSQLVERGDLTREQANAVQEALPAPSISLATACRWLHVLGFEWQGTRKKGAYTDGHEREDVKQKRAEFVKAILPLRARMATYANAEQDLQQPNLDDGTAPCCLQFGPDNPRRPLILVYQDESIFDPNMDVKGAWGVKGQSELRRKGKGVRLAQTIRKLQLCASFCVLGHIVQQDGFPIRRE